MTFSSLPATHCTYHELCLFIIIRSVDINSYHIFFVTVLWKRPLDPEYSKWIIPKQVQKLEYAISIHESSYEQKYLNFLHFIIGQKKWRNSSVQLKIWILPDFSYYACGKLSEIWQKPEISHAWSTYTEASCSSQISELADSISTDACACCEAFLGVLGSGKRFLGRLSLQGRGSPLEFSGYRIFKEILSPPPPPPRLALIHSGKKCFEHTTSLPCQLKWIEWQ